MASSYLNFKKLLPFVLLANIGGLEAKPAFFTIEELATPAEQQDSGAFIIAASPDGTLRETVSFAYSFGDYYRMTPKQMANPHASILPKVVFTPHSV